MTRIKLIASLIFMGCILAMPAALCADKNDKVVILKLDDLRSDREKGVLDQWRKIIEILKEEKVKGNIGIIAKYLDTGNAKFIEWTQEQHKSGNVEFWNQGYLHGQPKVDGKKTPEYKTPMAMQKEYFNKAQRAATDKLGFSFAAFGAPYNACDLNTVRLLAADPAIKVWIFGNQHMADVGGFQGVILPRVLNLEYPIGNPNLDAFKKAYAKAKHNKVITLQGHPPHWDKDGRYEQFREIIRFLKNEGWVFMTTSEYAELTTPQRNNQR